MNDDSAISETPRSTLTRLIRARHSTRAFLDRAVPISALREVFELAQIAPSSLNVQPWRTVVVSGARLEGLSKAMNQAFSDQIPMVLPGNLDVFKQHRTLFEDQLYFSEDGFAISRADKRLYTQAFKQNFDFYGAPTIAIIAIDNKLGTLDLVSVGIYLQTLVLLLEEKELQTCFQGTIAVWPDLIRKELGMADDLQLLCSLAIGYEDPGKHINQLRLKRKPWSDNVTFISE